LQFIVFLADIQDMITARKIFFDGSKYWLFQFSRDQHIIDRLERIEGAHYNHQKRGWLVPGTRATWTEFKSLFEKEEYQIERAYFSPRLSGHKVRIEVEPIPGQPDRLLVRLRKFTKAHLEGIRQVEGRQYHPELKYWSVPNNEASRADLKELLGVDVEYT